MSYRIVNSKVCLATVYDRYNIDYSDWEGRAPEWIESALSDMKLYRGYENTTLTREVVDFKAELPCDIKLLDYIVKDETEDGDETHIKEIRLTRAFFNSKKHIPHNTYRVLGNNWASFPFESGYVTFYYKRTPVEIDDKTKLEFPLIPDVQSLIEAIACYILIMILQRGHISQTFSLDSKNPYTNPHTLYYGSPNSSMGRIPGLRLKAKNDCSILDRDTQNQISTINRTLIVDGDIKPAIKHHDGINTNDSFIF